MSQQSRFPHFVSILVLLVAFTTIASARPQADSVILFIGDGMGDNHVEVARRATGKPLAMHRMPCSGMVTTLNAQGKVTDSAAASTALATGHKTNNGMLAMTPDGQRVESLLERCRQQGKSIGLITNDALTGATPAGFVAHVSSRGSSEEIAMQVAQSQAQILFGFGGKGAFAPKAEGGTRTDQQSIIVAMEQDGYEAVFTRAQLAKVTQPKVLGLFADASDAPSLAMLTQAAITRLSRNPNGFMLVIEQSKTDGKSHEKPGDISGIVADIQALDQAVSVALAHTKKHRRTLVIATADHETGGL